VVAAAALSLGTIGDPRAVPLLVARLDHREAPTRFDVAYALAELGDPHGRDVPSKSVLKSPMPVPGMPASCTCTMKQGASARGRQRPAATLDATARDVGRRYTVQCSSPIALASDRSTDEPRLRPASLL
jgi:hypothetical protein